MKKQLLSLIFAVIPLAILFSLSAETGQLREGSIVKVFPRKQSYIRARQKIQSPENTRDYYYFQDFESTPQYQLPTNWTGVVASEYPGANVRVTGYPAYESQRSLQIGPNNYNPDHIHEIYAITQGLDNISSKRIRFMCKGNIDNSELHIGTTEANSGFVNFVNAETIAVNYEWTEYLITFENVPNTSNYVAFKYYDNRSYIYIDNVLIEDVPTTPLLAVNTNHIDFGDVPHNRGVRNQIIAGNLGTLPLTAEFISNNNEYDFNPQQVIIEPESSIQVDVIFNPASATSSVGEYSGNFTLLTNDPSQAEITITTSANILPSLPPSTAIIGTGIEDYTNMFFRHNYACSYSQTIYYAEEISIANQRIEEISVYSNGNNVIGPVDIVIYLAHTDRTEFINESDWLDASEFTEVFNGRLERTDQTGWIDISLDVPYEYYIGQNLMVAVDKNGPITSHGSYSVFHSTNSEYTRSILAVDSNNIDPANPPESEFVDDVFIYDAFTNIKFNFATIPDSAELALYPVNNDYAFVEINNSPLEKTIKMKSIGLQTLTINEAPVITGPNSTEFTITGDLNNYPLTLLRGEIAEFNVAFQPSSRGFKQAQISLVNSSENIIHEVSLTGYGYEVDNNDSYSQATTLNLPLEGDMYEIYPINDIDWYLLPSLGVNDTLFVSYEEQEGQTLALNFNLYDIAIQNPYSPQSLASGSAIEFVIPQSGDYFLRVIQSGSNSSERTGVYELFVKSDYNFQYYSPVNV